MKIPSSGLLAARVKCCKCEREMNWSEVAATITTTEKGQVQRDYVCPECIYILPVEAEKIVRQELEMKDTDWRYCPTHKTANDIGKECPICEIVKALRTAPRQGAGTDEPEGARYIVISDTVANLIADTLEKG